MIHLSSDRTAAGVRHKNSQWRAFLFWVIFLRVVRLSDYWRPSMPECLVPESLTDLELERAKLLEQFLGLGDFPPGSITPSVRRCRKPSCHCANPKDPGHEPQFRLSRTVNGKTVTESFATPTAP